MLNNEFDDIRPYDDSEVPAAISRIIASKRVGGLLVPFLPQHEIDEVLSALPDVKTVDQFQFGIIKKIADAVLLKAGSELISENAEHLNTDCGYLFISNHRDIVLDPTFLDYILHLNHIQTVEIAIGNNLLIEPWIEDLVRVNKSFIVKRDVQGRELLLASMKMSSYIRYVVEQKKGNVWIAQREGRAKDGNDATQIALLKMLLMSARDSSPEDAFAVLNIIPVSISYEYDPCDVLKANELYQTATGGEFQKTPEMDLLSMKFGLTGLKGKICYAFGKVPDMTPLKEAEDVHSACEVLAKLIDNQIFSLTHLFSTHYIGWDLYYGVNDFSHKYTETDIAQFESIIDDKIRELLPLYDGNQEFRKFVYLQYANILKNALNL